LIAFRAIWLSSPEFDLTGSTPIDIYAFCFSLAFIDGTLVNCLANSKISL
jgi:hypothetical protein